MVFDLIALYMIMGVAFGVVSLLFGDYQWQEDTLLDNTLSVLIICTLCALFWPFIFCPTMDGDWGEPPSTV